MTSSRSNVYRMYKYLSLAFVFALFGLIGYGISTLSDKQDFSSESKPINTENVLNSSLESPVKIFGKDDSANSETAK